MIFTSKWIYSIRAIFDLVHHSGGKPVPLTSISQRQNISLPFLAQIFHKLRKGGIVKSIRGSKGGFVIARESKDITIGEIMRAVDERSFNATRSSQSKMTLQSGKLEECISNLLWRKLGEQIFELLDSTSIADLMKETECPEICAFIHHKTVKRKKR
jgi:Rrf2 family iron-sulfur cluster assembly transcriptional regulator